MSSEALEKKSFGKIEIFAPIGIIGRYHLKNTFLLSLVPLCCGMLLLLLLVTFAKLNVYFLESNGLILHEEVRDAYYKQVQLELAAGFWYLVLQLFVTAVVSFVIMRWATAPFRNAQKMIETAETHPDKLRPNPRWMSESPSFDRHIWLFALRVKGGGENQIPNDESWQPGLNLFFLVKFYLSFAVLSVATGYTMGILMGSVYDKIVQMALSLMPNIKLISHYFLAQSEILADATALVTGVSLVVYFFFGLHISRYMATMIGVFSRALQADKFPIALRSNDVYHPLAQILNRARKKIR